MTGTIVDDEHKEASSDSNQPTPSTWLLRSLFVLIGAIVAAYYTLPSKKLESIQTHSPPYSLCMRNGGKIYTVDQENSVKECMLIYDSHILATGTAEEMKEFWKTFAANNNDPADALFTRYIDGGYVFPGFTDSHAHILEYGASRQLQLGGTRTVNETVALVREYIIANKHIHDNPNKWVIGGGWDHTIWPTESWPTAADLDADPIIRGRPIVLQSKDCHALWVSTEALKSSLPFPESIDGGVIVRDASGDPSGVVLDNAQDFIKQPAPTEEDLIKHFTSTVDDALSMGLTSIHDAGLTPVSLEFFKRRAANGVLPIRIYGMTYYDEDGVYWGNKTKPIIGQGKQRLSARSVKIFADGALRTGGSALFEPYTDRPETNGFMRLPMWVLEEVVPQFLADGWQVNIHAIGDRANSLVLDAFEAALDKADVIALRPRLEHAQLMTNSDMKRLGKLGVIASVQPTHAISDMWYAQDRLGPERVKGLYAFRSLIDSGARIVFGSDAPVEELSPLTSFYAALTRVSADGTSPHGPGGWFPEQILTREEALRAMTIDPAHASFTEDTLGSLVPGKRADYVVLSQDIMTVPVSKILETKVIATVLDGEVAYGDLNIAAE